MASTDEHERELTELKRKWEESEAAYDAVKGGKRNKQGKFSEAKMKAMADRDKAKKAYNAASLKFKREEVAVQLEFINNAKNPFIIDGSDDDEDSEGDDDVLMEAPEASGTDKDTTMRSNASESSLTDSEDDSAEGNTKGGNTSMDVDEHPKTTPGDSVGGNEEEEEQGSSNLDVGAGTKAREEGAAGEKRDEEEEGSEADDLGRVALGDINSTIELPEDVRKFTYVYRSVDWKLVPTFENTGDWTNKEFSLRKRAYESGHELVYATRQHDQLAALKAKILEMQDNLEIKSSETVNTVFEIESGLRLASAHMARHTKERDFANREIAQMDQAKEDKVQVPQLTLEIESLYTQMATAPEDKLLKIRKTFQESCKDLDARLTMIPRKNIKFPAVPDSVLDGFMPNTRQRMLEPEIDTKGKKAKWEPKKYWELSEEDRAKETSDGEKLIRAYVRALKAGTDTKEVLDRFETCTIHFALEIQEFLPDCAGVTRELALHMHKSQWNNYSCRYHHRFRNRREHDFVGSTYTGVGFARKADLKSKKEIPAEPGHMHCGCAIDDVLFEFYLWKNSQLSSSNPKLSKDMFVLGDSDNISPQFRGYMIQMIYTYSGVRLNDVLLKEDIFSVDLDDQMIKIHKASIKYLVRKLKGALGVPVTVTYGDPDEIQGSSKVPSESSKQTETVNKEDGGKSGKKKRESSEKAKKGKNGNKEGKGKATGKSSTQTKGTKA